MRRSRHYRKRRPGRPGASPAAGPSSGAGASAPTQPTEIIQLTPRVTPSFQSMLKRTQARLIIDAGIGQPKIISQAIVVLNEIFPTHVRLFSEKRFDRDQVVTFNIPNLRNFFVKGKVAMCKELTLHPGIMPSSSYGYRIEVHFQFRSVAERDAVKQYVEYLAKMYLTPTAA